MSTIVSVTKPPHQTARWRRNQKAANRYSWRSTSHVVAAMRVKLLPVQMGMVWRGGKVGKRLLPPLPQLVIADKCLHLTFSR